MGEIAGAGLLSHVPTIMLPRAVRLRLNEGRESSLVTGLERVRREALDALRPDTFIVFDTHWFTTVEFAVSAHERRSGRYTSEELPHGIRGHPCDLAGSPALAREIAASVRDRAGLPCVAIDDEHLPVHYPTLNLAHYLDWGERWISVGICQTATDADFLAVGAALSRAEEASNERVVLLASGGMSHRFRPLAENLLRREVKLDLLLHVAGCRVWTNSAGSTSTTCAGNSKSTRWGRSGSCRRWRPACRRPRRWAS